ncbi:MAG: aldehyde dehydrogenase family protein, partial [Candidatus Bathyarchaeia archaeon]
MPFENENTWFNARRLGRAEEFHSNYEKALETVRAKLGAHNPLHIGSQAVKTSGEFTDTSPTDTRMILGYFQRATAKDARDAISAAAAAFTPWSEMDYRQRSAIIRKAADIMSRRKFELAALTTL